MAKSRVPRTFAELVQMLGNVVRGLDAVGKTDETQKKYRSTLSELLNGTVKLDQQQETLKVQLVQTTSELEKKQQEARDVLTRVISYLESVYGKTAPELNNYGISPRRFFIPKRTKAQEAGTVAP